MDQILNWQKKTASSITSAGRKEEIRYIYLVSHSLIHMREECKAQISFLALMIQKPIQLWAWVDLNSAWYIGVLKLFKQTKQLTASENPGALSFPFLYLWCCCDWFYLISCQSSYIHNNSCFKVGSNSFCHQASWPFSFCCVKFFSFSFFFCTKFN